MPFLTVYAHYRALNALPGKVPKFERQDWNMKALFQVIFDEYMPGTNPDDYEPDRKQTQAV